MIARLRREKSDMTKKEFLEMLANSSDNDDIIIKILNPERQEFVPVKESCLVGNALLLLYDDKPTQ